VDRPTAPMRRFYRARAAGTRDDRWPVTPQ